MDRSLKTTALLVLSAVMLLLGNKSLAAVSIPFDAVIYNGHSYRYYISSKSWKDAKIACEALGGHLVSITSAGEQDAVEKYLKSVTSGAVYIGLSDADGENGWSVWTTGESVTYTNWGTNEPDDAFGGQDYAVILVTGTAKGTTENSSIESKNGQPYYVAEGQWDDNQDARKSYLCEWDQVAAYNIEDAVFAINESYVYNDNPIKPVNRITYQNYTLQEGKHYSISYSNNDSPGQASVTISGITPFYGSVTRSFLILPKKVSGLSVKYLDSPKERTAEVTFDGQKGVSGYQVYYCKSTDSESHIAEFIPASGTGKQTYQLKNLQKGITYRVKVNAYVTVGTRKFGEWSSENSVTVPAKLLVSDFWGINNYNANIDASYYEHFMGSAKAQNLAGPTGGICYGLTVSALASIKNDYPPVSSWGDVSQLSEVTSRNTKSTKTGRTVAEYAKYAHVIQRLPYTENQRGGNFGKLNDLYKATKSAGNNGSAVVVKLVGAKFWSKGLNGYNHAIAALEVAEETETEVKIRCYDSNYPNNTDKYLILYRENKNGPFVSWKYPGYSGKEGVTQGNVIKGRNNDLITYETNTSDFFVQEDRLLSASQNYENYLLLNVQLTQDEIDQIADSIDDHDLQISIPVPSDGSYAENGDGGFYFWTKQQLIDLGSLPAGSTVTLASDYHSAKVTIEKEADVTLKVGKTKDIFVLVKPSSESTVLVETYNASSSDNGIDSKIIKAEVDGGRSLGIVQSESDLVLNGAASFSVTEKEGTEGSNGSLNYSKTEYVQLQHAESKREYQLTRSSSGGLEIKTKSETGGGFDTIVPADQNSGTKVPGKGTVLKDSRTGYTYKVTSAGKTVSFSGISSSVKSVVIPATVTINGIKYRVTSVTAKALYKNKKITKISVGKNVKSIGKNAFANCTKLTSVTIGNSVTTIGDKAFFKCTALTKITIPAKVTKIGKSAFQGCKKLKTITIKSTKLSAKKVGAKAFTGTSASATVKVPKKSLKSYKTWLVKKGINKKAKIKS